MKGAILQCDNVLDQFRAEFGQYSEMIQQMFHAVDSSIVFDIFDCQQGEYPDDLDLYDFFITTGSKASAYEDIPWIKQLITFVQKLDKANKKLIGICFGHQIIAIAFHGKVVRSEKGWGIGVANNRMIAAPDWMSTTSTELNIIASHQDQISELPNDANVIAKSEFCPYFVVQWNDNFLSIQGHPEWNCQYSEALINNRKGVIPAKRIEEGLKSLTIPTDNIMLTQWAIDFIKN
ncbi:MAG: GMP synthase [Gammaproteobacteria bacterium]|nr:GMP synthase [Gammaproteobacteria bacterium]